MRKFLKILIIFSIAMLIGNMTYGMFQEMSISDAPSYQNVELAIEEENGQKTETDVILWEEIPLQYQGYDVCAKLTIPKIALETYVFSVYDEEAMWICPTKYFGPEPNEEGNFCIAAHNYDKENMFNHLIDLEKGDSVYLTDNTHGKIEYRVTDIYKAEPNNTEPLSQETNGKKCITLITCSDYSSKRIIVKACGV